MSTRPTSFWGLKRRRHLGSADRRGRPCALAALVVVLALVAAAFAWLGPLRAPLGRSEQAVPVLDPTQMLALRTPGG